MKASSTLITTRRFVVPRSLWQLACLPLAVFLFALSPFCLAVDPAPDGGYPTQNTAEGEDALFSLTTGQDDTAIGFQALYSATTALQDTALGSLALHNNTTGGANVGVGYQALLGNTTGGFNVAIGNNAMVANSTGGDSVAVGYTALQAHTNGFDNVAIGYGAMSLGTTGDSNVAVGKSAMAFSTGIQNTALGDSAMNAATGDFNVAVGRSAGLNFAGDENIAIGHLAGQNVTSGSNNIEIGNQGRPNDGNTIRLGDTAVHKKTFVAGINGTTVSGGVAVMVNSKGQLGVATSSARYKDNVQPMEKSSEAILSLKPVSFRYKKDIDPEAIPQFGLLAEDVAKVDPDLVARDEGGKPYTVRYEAVNAMLLNEFLKAHEKLEEQGKEISELKAAVERLEAGQSKNVPVSPPQ